MVDTTLDRSQPAAPDEPDHEAGDGCRRRDPVALIRHRSGDPSTLTSEMNSPESDPTTVVNAVGVVAFGPVDELSIDVLEELFLTNTFVPILLAKAALAAFDQALAREARRVGVRVIDARPPHTETGLVDRAVAGTAPRLPEGLTPETVASTIVDAIAAGKATELPGSSFGPRPSTAPVNG